MFSGYFIMAIAYLSYIFANNPIHVFVIQIGLSLGETIINPSWSAVIAASLEKGKAHTIYANFFGYRSLFEGISAIIGGVFAMTFGFNLVFTIMFCLALTSGIFALLINEKTLLNNT
jgi:MFS family permease